MPGEAVNGVDGEAGGEHALDIHDAVGNAVDILLVNAGEGAAVGVLMVDGVEDLGGKGEEEKDGGDDFAGAALGEPALDPGEDGAGEKKVEEDEESESENGPREEVRAGDADADGDGRAPDDTDERGRRGKTVDEIEDDPGTKADGIAKEVAKLGILSAEGGGECGKKLPCQQENPELNGDAEEAAMRGCGPGADAEADRGAEGDAGKYDEHEDLRAEFEASAAGSQGVDQGAELNPGNRGVLLAGERRKEASGGSGLRGLRRSYASHESSGTGSSAVPEPAPLTMRRKISSRVSFWPASASSPGIAATPARSSSTEPLATRRPW